MRLFIRPTRLIATFLSIQSAVILLLNQRQDLALLISVPGVILSFICLLLLSSRVKFTFFSSGNIAFSIMLLALMSNISYFFSVTSEPFLFWVRLLSPLLLILLSGRLFFNDQKCFSILVLTFSIALLFSVSKTFELSAELAIQHGIERQTNWGNAVAATSPFIFLLKRRSLTNILFLVALVALLVSLKRSALLAATVLIFAYVWPYVRRIGPRYIFSPSTILSVFTGITMIIGALYYLFSSDILSNYFIRSESRILDALYDKGSGRLFLWETASNIVGDSNPLTFVFGRGYGWFQEVAKTSGFIDVSLHNDFAEFFVSFGLLGFLLFFALMLRVLYLAIIFSSSSDLAIASFSISASLIFLIYSSLAGVFFYYFFFTPLYIAIGYMEARFQSMLLLARVPGGGVILPAAQPRRSRG